MPKPRVVVLGGGMAGLTTAWELTTGDWQDRYESITLYQRGWRLGGKGASSRGIHGRIEEHGLHVLLGYYQETFRIMGECYAELNRADSDPDCPIRSWSDAVRPAPMVGLAEDGSGSWLPWVMTFPSTPGMPGGRATDVRLSPLDLVVQSVRLLAAFHTALQPPARSPAAVLSASPIPPRPDVVGDWLRGIGLTVLAGALEALTRIDRGIGAMAGARLAGLLDAGLSRIRVSLDESLQSAPRGAATGALVELVFANLVGIVRDRLAIRHDGLAAINDMDYRDWLRRHGASSAALDCAIVRGMYDLVFAFRDGDPEQPAFAAGLGLELATRMLYDYDGSLFWKMEAGMGEIVFAPLFQVLEERGVRFEFFHRIDEVRSDAGKVTSIAMAKQAELRQEDRGYRPLGLHDGLPTWPATPDHDQLVGSGPWLDGAESFYGERRDHASLVLHADSDFDVVVFAASLGIVPYVCGDLVEQDPRWRAMVDNIGTVATKAFQIWLTADEAALGWTMGSGVTLSGFASPFDTWASMSHLIGREGWDTGGVASIAYFCSSLGDTADQAGAAFAVRLAAEEFLDREIGAIWPNAIDGDGRFRWELLLADDTAAGRERMASQYWRANVDPSDRYVQSLPGTDRYRLAPGDSGFDNLVLAGDWTDCGLNAGCLEAAARSGVLAASAVHDKTQERNGAQQ